MDYRAISCIQGYVCDPEGFGAAEEQQVAGLPPAFGNRLSTLYLLAGVAGQDEAVHIVAELHQPAAVEVLDGVAAPHIGGAGEAAGELQDVFGIGLQGRGASRKVGYVCRGYPAEASVGELYLCPAAAGAGFSGLAHKVAHSEVADGVAVFAGLFPHAGVLCGAYPFGRCEPGVLFFVSEFVDREVGDPAGVVFRADLDPVAVGLSEGLHKGPHKHLVVKGRLIIWLRPHKTGRQRHHRPAE